MSSRAERRPGWYALPGKRRPSDPCLRGGWRCGRRCHRARCHWKLNVTVLGRSLSRLVELDWRYVVQINTVYPIVDAVERHVRDADLVIGSVLVPRAAAPKVVTEEMIKSIRPSAVSLDNAIDQDGCFKTSRPTSYADTVYTEDGVIHYCITNMRGVVAQTSAFALKNATMPYMLKPANMGWREALYSESGVPSRPQRLSRQSNLSSHRGWRRHGYTPV